MKTHSKATFGLLVGALIAAVPLAPAGAATSASSYEQIAEVPSSVATSIERSDTEDFDNIQVYQPGEAQDSNSVRAAKGGGTCTAPGGAQVTCQDGTGYVVTRGPVSGMRLAYNWSVAWYSSSNANVIGRGYTNGRETWHGGGSAKSGSFTVPWYGSGGSEVMSVKKVKVRSMNPPAGVVVNWN